MAHVKKNLTGTYKKLYDSAMKIQLDKQKLDRLLKLHNKNYPWIANKLNWSRQRLHYNLKHRTVVCADACAPLFGLKGKDLIR